MDLVDRAEAARLAGDLKLATTIYRRALKRELRALDLLTTLHPYVEPSWSVMHASAAAIAMKASDFRKAEQLIGTGLAADTTDDVLDELRDLLDEVQFRRHLDLQGIQLRGAQFQLSLSGPAVATGMASAEVTSRRTDNVRRLLLRTAERKADVPFRNDGVVSLGVRQGLVIQFSPPRAASYALTVSIEQRSRQLPLPLAGVGPTLKAPDPGEVMAEFFDCVRLVEEGRLEELRSRIGNEDYFINFVSLARGLAPDGKDVTTVGFTRGNGRGKSNTIAFRRKPRGIEMPEHIKGSSTHVEITGVLDGADGQSTQRGADGYVVIVDDARKRHQLRVPKAILADTVRPRFLERVTVRASVVGKEMVFLDILDPTSAEP